MLKLQRVVRVFVVVMVVALTIAPAAMQAVCDPSVDHAAVGAAAYQAADYPTAIAAYECALTADPYNPELLSAAADAYLLDGQLLTTREYYYHALNWLAFASSMEYGDFYDEQSAQRDAAVAAAPDSFAALITRAVWLWMTGSDDEALEDALAAREIEPNSVLVYTLQGASMAALGDMDAANALFEQALEIGAENPHIAAFIATVLVDIGDLERAQALMEGAHAAIHELKPGDPGSSFFDGELAYIYLSVGNDQGYIDLMEPLLNVKAVDQFTAYDRVRISAVYLRLGNREAAQRYIDQVLTLVDTYPVLLGELAYAFTGVDDQLATEYYALYAQATGTEPIRLVQIEIGQAITVEMAPGRSYYLLFTAQAGQTLTFSAPANDTLDPLIFVMDRQGIMLVRNNDVSLISGWEVPADGMYTLVVMSGGEGTTEVSITAE